MSVSDPSAVSPLFIQRCADGFYDDVANDVLAMGTVALSGAEYNDSFYRVIEQWSNNYLYRNRDGREFRTNIVGEVCSEELGTIIGAKGNHYAGRAGQPFRTINDDSKVKNIIVLGMPSCSSPFLAVMYQNQIGTLNAVREADEEEERSLAVSYSVREWIKGAAADASLPHDLIVLHTSPIYVHPNKGLSSAVRIGKKVVSDIKGGSVIMSKSDGDEESKDKQANVEVKLGALYDPHMMLDYGGPYFSHQVSKLAQLDIVDEEDRLVPPWEMYDKLRTGTLILANCSLHCFLMADAKAQRKLYQINIHSIKIIAHSDQPVRMPICPSIPSAVVGDNRSASTSAILPETKSVANEAFAKFSSSKKWQASSLEVVHADDVPEKKRKGKGRAKNNVKTEEDFMQLT